MREVESWLSEKDIKSIHTSSYWNNIDVEREKEWWIESGDYEKCLSYLKSSGIMHEYEESEEFIKNFPGNSLKVADLAAGIGWTSVLLSKLPKVSEVHAVEISKHRLGSLFEHSVKMLSGQEDKIFRYLGSFYDLNFPDNSMDVIYMSQSFHHADNPLKLIVECDRVLKNKGRIILVGEHYIGMSKIIRAFMSNLIKRRRIVTNFFKMFPPDKEIGDHYYKISDYYFMFGVIGYEVSRQFLENGKVIYIADKNW